METQGGVLGPVKDMERSFTHEGIRPQGERPGPRDVTLPEPTVGTVTTSGPQVIPYVCPVCNGAGTVSRPPWVAGDVYSWPGSTCCTWPCRACNGTGVIWSVAREL